MKYQHVPTTRTKPAPMQNVHFNGRIFQTVSGLFCRCSLPQSKSSRTGRFLRLTMCFGIEFKWDFLIARFFDVETFAKPKYCHLKCRLATAKQLRGWPKPRFHIARTFGVLSSVSQQSTARAPKSNPTNDNLDSGLNVYGYMNISVRMCHGLHQKASSISLPTRTR